MHTESGSMLESDSVTGGLCVLVAHGPYVRVGVCEVARRLWMIVFCLDSNINVAGFFRQLKFVCYAHWYCIGTHMIFKYRELL